MDINRNEILIKWTKRILKVCVAILGFQYFISTFNYIYVDNEPWYRIMWHHYYETEGNIDCLCLGSSHVYCDINPIQLDSESNDRWFNLASPGQRLCDSYYLLREADSGNELSQVFLELYYVYSTKDNLKNDIDPIQDEEICYRSWQNADYMQGSYNKLTYMFSLLETGNFTDVFFPFCRYRSNLDDWYYVKRTVEKKQEDSYQNYEFRYYFEDGSYYEFLKQGYFFSTREFETSLFEQTRVLDENPLGQLSEKYLREIISYCQKRNITITLFVSPMNNLQLISTEKYDNFIDQVRKIADEYSIDFYDFNLTKEEYLPIHAKEYFYDIDHLNGAGANLFTSFFYKVISGNADENEKYFYTSYKEKMRETASTVYGLYYRDFNVRRFYIASNCEEELEYKIVITPTQGEAYMVQDYCANKVFDLPLNEHGECTIYFKGINESDSATQILETGF